MEYRDNQIKQRQMSNLDQNYLMCTEKLTCISSWLHDRDQEDCGVTGLRLFVASTHPWSVGIVLPNVKTQALQTVMASQPVSTAVHMNTRKH